MSYSVLILSMVLCCPYVLGGNYNSQSGVDGWSLQSSDSGKTGDPERWTEQPWGYSGPVAIPDVLPDGSLADVPEVAAARIAHLSALQAAALDPRAADGDDGSYDVYKYGDNRYPYHDDLISDRPGTNLVAWEVETQHKPLPNPHAREAAAKAWLETQHKPLPNPHAREAAAKAWRV